MNALSQKYAGLVCVCCSLLLSTPVFAFDADSLSFFEKPNAYQTKYGILEFNSFADLGYQTRNNGSAKFDTYQVATRASLKTQLKNDWDLTIQYIADYGNERNESYQDLFRIGVADQWGEVQIGDISSLIFERTNRQRAIGLLGADNDQFTLNLEDYGLFYQWQTAASQVMVAVDSDASVELGANFYKPVNGIEYVVAFRANKIDKDDADAQGVGASDAFAVVAQAQRGRWLMDMQYMREQLAFLFNQQSFKLQGVSAGLHYSLDRSQWSLTGLTRENELNNEERVVSLGFRYDLARGLSLNAGASVRNSKLFPEKLKSFATSLRYEF